MNELSYTDTCLVTLCRVSEQKKDNYDTYVIVQNYHLY
jgi:hypothetical protein